MTAADPNPLAWRDAPVVVTAATDFSDMIARLVDFQGEVRWDAERPDGQPRRRLDTATALELLGFEPRVTLEEGLSRTVAAFEDSPSTL